MEKERSVVEFLVNIGEARGILDRIVSDLNEIDMSKHNKFWTSEDEKQDEFLWKVRGFLRRVEDDLNDIYQLLSN